MCDSENEVISEEEVKEKLILIRKEIMSRNLKRTELKEKYGISLFALRDLGDMTSQDFNNLLEQISYIKQNMKSGKLTSKIAAELSCGTSIVSFIAKETCKGYSKNRVNKEIQYRELFKKIERIWKENQIGEDIENLASKYDINIRELEQLLINFSNLIKKKQKHFRKIQDTEVKTLEAKRLKEKWDLDDDTIAYIVEGKEIEKVKEEEGASLDEP